MLINIEDLNMDPLREKKFKEYLDFVLDSKRSFSFVDFTKHCGISRKQWELFKFNHKEELDVDWIMD
ncbi:hypothetical protein KY328_05680 [Candidatus Woesearchaeota archaeon]|nr:hypothetical protein [Candidatus Woesearchaeota archaeon]MBW3022389.1 hypothetical protein [Candidatus Woesearchaeota archaeon]